MYVQQRWDWKKKLKKKKRQCDVRWRIATESEDSIEILVHLCRYRYVYTSN